LVRQNGKKKTVAARKIKCPSCVGGGGGKKNQRRWGKGVDALKIGKITAPENVCREKVFQPKIWMLSGKGDQGKKTKRGRNGVTIKQPRTTRAETTRTRERPGEKEKTRL